MYLSGTSDFKNSKSMRCVTHLSNASYFFLYECLSSSYDKSNEKYHALS